MLGGLGPALLGEGEPGGVPDQVTGGPPRHHQQGRALPVTVPGPGHSAGRVGDARLHRQDPGPGRGGGGRDRGGWVRGGGGGGDGPVYEGGGDPRQDVSLAVTPPGRSLRAAGERHLPTRNPVHGALADHQDLPQGQGQGGAHLVLGEGAGACWATERVVEVVELNSVGCDDGSPVAGQGAGLVDQVPQTVPVDDDRDGERHDLLQHQRDPAQHGLVPAQTGPDHDTVEPGEPGVHLLHAVLLVKDGVDHQGGAEAADDVGRGDLAEDVDTVRPCVEGRHSAGRSIVRGRRREVLTCSTRLQSTGNNLRISPLARSRPSWNYILKLHFYIYILIRIWRFSFKVRNIFILAKKKMQWILLSIHLNWIQLA